MAAEARALGRWTDHPGVRVAVTGARPEAAEAAARTLSAAGAGILLSWGIAGGLDPRHAPGTLVVGTAVITPSRRCIVLTVVPDGIPGTVAGPLLGADAVLLSPAVKAALHGDTGAIAVDMETHRVAEVALSSGLRCAAVRAVSDPAGRSLPALAASALGPDGQPRIGAVFAEIVRRPGDLPALLRAATDSRAALAALRSAADAVIGALLAGPR